MIEPPTWLPLGYHLERDADILTLRRSDGPVVAYFSARGTTRDAVLRAIEEDRSGRPGYTGPEQHAESVERLVRVRIESPWERFLKTERRMLEARKNGQLAKALVRALPGESQRELDQMASDDRRRAEEELLEPKSEDGKLYYKHIEELSAEYGPDRIRAELARLEWLLERQGRRNIVLR